MTPEDQERFFAGAIKHGNLPQAFWEVASDADAMRGDHEQYVKQAFKRALRAAEADAYRRGAEAMREAAAASLVTSLPDYIAESVRALPLPDYQLRRKERGS